MNTKLPDGATQPNRAMTEILRDVRSATPEEPIEQGQNLAKNYKPGPRQAVAQPNQAKPSSLHTDYENEKTFASRYLNDVYPVALSAPVDSPTAPARVNDKPPAHWTQNDGWKRHPQTAEEWNWHNDHDHIGVVPDRSEQRLNFAMDRADPHAPDQMALVLRIDLLRLHGRMITAEAYKKSRLARAASPTPDMKDACDRAEILIERFKNCGYLTESGIKFAAPHIRIALDVEVEAGGPYLVGAQKVESPTTPVAWMYRSYLNIGGPRESWGLSEPRVTNDLENTRKHPGGGEWPLAEIQPLYLHASPTPDMKDAAPAESPTTPTAAPQRPRLNFWAWWRRDGKFYDPDTEDVPWYDKRKFLAERAFDAGVAQSSNYTANEEVNPWIVAFANGRVVSIAFDDGEPYLEVRIEEQLTVTAASPTPDMKDAAEIEPVADGGGTPPVGEENYGKPVVESLRAALASSQETLRLARERVRQAVELLNETDGHHSIDKSFIAEAILLLKPAIDGGK